jgi:hypothetical protein
VNIQGDTIEEAEINSERNNVRHSSWHWPVQQRPPRTMWNKWKAAMLEVFTDETTLPTPMGDWLDTQTHQEFERWLILQERSICQKTMVNGYSMHNKISADFGSPRHLG